LQVYTALKEQKQRLKENIIYLQINNARLQKEYFELKSVNEFSESIESSKNE